MEREMLRMFELLVISFISYGFVFLPKLRCKTEICAVCTGYHKRRNKGWDNYYPLFEYEYNGKKYSRQSMSVTKKRYLPLYTYGTYHKIWIDERHPGICLCTRDFTGVDAFTIVFASIWFFVAILMLMTNLGIMA